MKSEYVNLATGLQNDKVSSCPPSFHWRGDVLEKDLHIHSTSVTVLAMDGRKRWLDIRNQVGQLNPLCSLP